MAQHSHKFMIGDDDAARVLLDKLVKGGRKPARREKLLRALNCVRLRAAEACR